MERQKLEAIGLILGETRRLMQGVRAEMAAGRHRLDAMERDLVSLEWCVEAAQEQARAALQQAGTADDGRERETVQGKR